MGSLGLEKKMRDHSHLLMEQVEFADVILLNRTDLVMKRNKESSWYHSFS